VANCQLGAEICYTDDPLPTGDKRTAYPYDTIQQPRVTIQQPL